MKKFYTSGPRVLLALALCCCAISCNKSPDQISQSPATSEPVTDPAQANLAPAAPQPSQSVAQYPAPMPTQLRPAQSYPPPSQSYPPPAQPVPEPVAQSNSQGYADNYANNYADPDDSDEGEPAIQASYPPPPLPEYRQPETPGENYLWNPGYWGYASAGYYWVPGIWVMAPYVGALWTPPYWGYGGNRYDWHHGYWASHVGFYGGVNYGYGYVGRGYEGGYWSRGQFAYNSTVNNVNTTVIHNVYNYRVTNVTNVRISYNGGRGGLNARATAAEVAALREQRLAPLPAQVAHLRQAETNRAQFAAVNNGRPPTLVAAGPLATTYRSPAPHAMAVPGARILPPPRSAAIRETLAPMPRVAQAQPNARPAERTIAAPRAEERGNPMRNPIPNSSPNPAPAARVTTPNRPMEQPQQNPVPSARPQSRPAPAVEPRATAPSRPIPVRPIAEPRPVTRPEIRPVPQPRPEERPMPEPRSEPRNEPRSEPAPQAHPDIRPAPRPEAKPQREEPKKATDHEHN